MRDTIKGLIDYQVQHISDLQVQAAAVTTKLRDFEEQCKTDQTKMTTVQSDVTRSLKTKGTDVDSLKTKIEGWRQEIRDAWKEARINFLSFCWPFADEVPVLSVVVGGWYVYARSCATSLKNNRGLQM
jgi:hypothetical protein